MVALDEFSRAKEILRDSGVWTTMVWLGCAMEEFSSGRTLRDLWNGWCDGSKEVRLGRSGA